MPKQCGPCEDCRYWSEMLAAVDNGSVKAVCAAVGGPQQGKWVRDLESRVAFLEEQLREAELQERLRDRSTT